MFRIKSLKKIQLEATNIEAKFYEEVHELEVKYHSLYQPLYNKRATITKGNFIFSSSSMERGSSLISRGESSQVRNVCAERINVFFSLNV